MKPKKFVKLPVKFFEYLCFPFFWTLVAWFFVTMYSICLFFIIFHIFKISVSPILPCKCLLSKNANKYFYIIFWCFDNFVDKKWNESDTIDILGIVIKGNKWNILPSLYSCESYLLLYRISSKSDSSKYSSSWMIVKALPYGRFRPEINWSHTRQACEFTWIRTSRKNRRIVIDHMSGIFKLIFSDSLSAEKGGNQPRSQLIVQNVSLYSLTSWILDLSKKVYFITCPPPGFKKPDSG